MGTLTFAGFYCCVFLNAWRAARTWVRDNVFVAGIMAIVPAVAIYLTDRSHAIDWPVIRLTLWMYAGLLILYYVCHLIRAPWLIHRTKEEELATVSNERNLFAAKLKEFSDAKPNIVLREPAAKHVERIRINWHQRSVIRQFVKVRFINEPSGKFLGSIARGVTAKVKFFSMAGALLLDMDGRWDDSDQPSTRPYGQSKNDLLAAEFKIKGEHNLDIAFWDDSQHQFVAFNNDSYDYSDWRKPEYVLSEKQLRVVINLVDEWVDETFSFDFSIKKDQDVVIL
jgi:hypothetical protein